MGCLFCVCVNFKDVQELTPKNQEPSTVCELPTQKQPTSDKLIQLEDELSQLRAMIAAVVVKQET